MWGKHERRLLHRSSSVGAGRQDTGEEARREHFFPRDTQAPQPPAPQKSSRHSSEPVHPSGLICGAPEGPAARCRTPQRCSFLCCPPAAAGPPGSRAPLRRGRSSPVGPSPRPSLPSRLWGSGGPGGCPTGLGECLSPYLQQSFKNQSVKRAEQCAYLSAWLHA